MKVIVDLNDFPGNALVGYTTQYIFDRLKWAYPDVSREYLHIVADRTVAAPADAKITSNLKDIMDGF